MAKNEFPKQLYVKTEAPDGVPYFVAADSAEGLNVDTGERTPIALYELINVGTAMGAVITKFGPVKRR